MDFGPGSGVPREVAVGPSREVAAQVFGDRFDEPLVTSYAAFDTDVDLVAGGTIGIVAAPGLNGLIDRLERQAPHLWPQHVLLGLPPGLEGRDVLETTLATLPSVAVKDLVLTDRGVVVVLDHASEVEPERGARFLAELRGATPPHGRSHPAGTEPARPDRTPRRVRLRAAIAATALLVALLAVALLLAGRGAGTDGVVVTLLVATLVAQGITLVGVGYAVRISREGRAELLELRRLASRKPGTRDQEVSRHLARVEEEILALGRLQARARVERREDS